MPVVDADAHVDETEETWRYIDEPLKRYTPITITQEMGSDAGAQPKGYNRFWLSDGRFLVRRVRDDVRTRTTLETRELLDVPARMRHLDELGIDLQVCYPTSFLMRWNPSDQVEHALRKSYNRWMGSKWAQSDNRMRWVALDPSAETVTDSRPISITVNRLAIVSPSAAARISLPSRKIAYLALPPVGVVFSTKPAYFTSVLGLERGAGRGVVVGAGVCEVLVGGGGGGGVAVPVDRGSGP